MRGWSWMAAVLCCVACAEHTQVMGDGRDAGEVDAGGSGATSGSGGVGGTSGSGGSGGSGGAAGSAGGDLGINGRVGECMEDADCKLVGDCCNCYSVPLNEDVPVACAADCAIDRCTTMDVTPICMMGRCVFEENCDAMYQEVCTMVPPECGPGQQPIVRDGCFGECIDARDCRGVSSCDVCAPGQACVFPNEKAWGRSPMIYLQCWDVAPACDGVPTCECMGDEMCSPIWCREGTFLPNVPADFQCDCPFC